MLDPQTLKELQTVLMGGSMLWAIGRVVHWFNGRANETKRVHGQFIPEWIGGTYISCGLLALFWFGPAPRIPAPPSLTFASFGLLIGLAAGWVHGNVRLRLHREHNKDSERQRLNRATDDGNPYRPP
ncbi:membrane protein [Rhodopirellula europaea 6C]|uniref:Membrane protein n=1 Tax=Rhodopirellula europaea 6C TaxID=1263867 RepID=M2B4J2_9BACT|nr:membrane protein [Rhodopirellula europaea 6C]